MQLAKYLHNHIYIRIIRINTYTATPYIVWEMFGSTVCLYTCQYQFNFINIATCQYYLIIIIINFIDYNKVPGGPSIVSHNIHN